MFKLDKNLVLVPFNDTEPCWSAVEAAQAFVDDASKVTVLHAVAPVPPLATDADGRNKDLQADFPAKKKELVDKLEAAGHGGCNPVIIWGDPGEAITHYAAREGAELIIMPSHGRTGVKRLILGSVTEYVLRRAQCPVLVLREPVPDADEGAQ